MKKKKEAPPVVKTAPGWTVREGVILFCDGCKIRTGKKEDGTYDKVVYKYHPEKRWTTAYCETCAISRGLMGDDKSLAEHAAISPAGEGKL